MGHIKLHIKEKGDDEVRQMDKQDNYILDVAPLHLIIQVSREAAIPAT